MNIFRILGDLSHIAAILLLLYKLHTLRSCSGISFKTQALYALVFVTRYTDLSCYFNFGFFYYDNSFVSCYFSLYVVVAKVFFIANSFYVLFLMRYPFRSTSSTATDTFRIEYLIIPSAFLALLFHYRCTPPLQEFLWSFSIFLESVAVLPQLTMLRRAGGADTGITCYLIALGAYRALYLPNWAYRWFAQGMFDPIAVSAGIVQTAIYFDYAQTLYPSICARVGDLCSTTSNQVEGPSADLSVKTIGSSVDTQEKALSDLENAWVAPDNTREQIEKIVSADGMPVLETAMLTTDSNATME